MDILECNPSVCETGPALSPTPDQDGPGEVASQPRVVILGAGFAGLSAAKALAKAPVCLTLIDQRNYHLFQPLLYQVATAGLSPADIATPIRSILSRQRNARVLLGRVTGIDTARRAILLDDREIPYDILIVATGARHAYFGHDEWESVALGLKRIEDATAMRRQILLSFERAECATDPAERRSLLARTIRARLNEAQSPAPFRYRNYGSLATVGRKIAVADFGRLRLSGRLAWWLWGAVHIFFLIGFRNRIAITLNWLWAYFTFERGARLITGPMS